MLLLVSRVPNNRHPANCNERQPQLSKRIYNISKSAREKKPKIKHPLLMFFFAIIFLQLLTFSVAPKKKRLKYIRFYILFIVSCTV